MALANIERVRAYVAGILRNDLDRLRVWISMLDGSGPAVESLRHADLNLIHAKITEQVLEHIGVKTAVKATDPKRGTESKAGRAAAKAGAKLKGGEPLASDGV